MTPNKEQSAEADLDKWMQRLGWHKVDKGRGITWYMDNQMGEMPGMMALAMYDSIQVQIAEAEKAAEQNAVAWCIGAIDDLHTNHSDTLQMSLESDRCYKGIKNTIRDRYRSVTGIDPAPNYPIKATLRSERLSELQEDGNA